KGGDLIPLFAKQVLEANPNLHLLIGGRGPLENNLKEATENASWSNRLHWLGWESDGRRAMAASDFCFLLSREESFPQVLLEASALGLPWIAPGVGGIPDLVAAGAVGTLFEAGNPGS